MPHLMLFAPCQQVAYDAVDNTPSLIGIFQGFTATLAIQQESVPNIPTATIETAKEGATAIPLRWVAFAMWLKLAGDENKQFTQICELIKPNGESSMKQALKFQMTASFHRNTINVQNFPIDQDGVYQLRLFLQEGDGEPKLISEYPISVTHKVDLAVNT